jgi:hypothetical protein
MCMQPLLQWKRNKYYTLWMCVCKLSYPARHARVPYCHLWPDRLRNIFPVYLKKTWFGGGCVCVSEHKMCHLISCTTFVWTISHSKKWPSYYHKCTYIGVHVKYRHSCQIVMKLESLWQSFKKYSNIKYHENPSSGSRVVALRQMDRQTNTHYDEDNTHFSQFCKYT